MTVPPRDSSIRLAPGEEFTLDSDGSHEWRAKTSSLRTARGTILALAFEVEHSIDVVINRFFFPADDKTSEDLKTLFVGLFLKSPSASFARKIQVFKALSQQPILSNLVRPDLLRNLERLRDIRNRFAHYPITFAPSSGQNKEKLVAILVCRDKEITLDEVFFKDNEKLFTSVQGELERVLSVFGVNKS